MKNYVYLTINKLNPEKIYVGITLKPISSGYKGSGSFFSKALKEFGRKNFERFDIGSFENRQEAHFWEKFYIRTLKTHISQGGYNISRTGGTYNGKHSEETIILMKEKSRGKNKGKKTSEKRKKEISQIMQGNKNALGNTHTPETLEKISNASKKMWENRKNKR